MMKTGLSSHRPLSGQLYKYTNVVKGWQQRWFAVDPETGVLSYYLFDGPGDTVQPGQPARGEAHLAAAVICPSDEDSRTFTINCASGDMLKLRATDARARQEWVNGLRAIAEIHTKAMGASPALQAREQLAVHDAMASARQQLQAAELSDAALARCIEGADSPFPHTDPDLLLLKATSAASMQCLLQCLGILLRQQQYATSLKHSDIDQACYDNYCDYYKCTRLLGDVDDCKIFKRYFETICPNFWIEHWNELREKGAFPGPI